MAKTRVTWTECFLAGILLFGLAGTGGALLLLDGLIRFIRSDQGLWEGLDLSVVACAAASASIAGVAAWRLIVATTEASPRRGALAGLFVGVAAHPLCWLLVLLYQVARDPAFRGQSIPDLASTLVIMTVWATFSSLGLVGWISSPLGAMLGYMARRLTAKASVHA